MKIWPFLALSVTLLVSTTSCVTTKVHEQLQAKYDVLAEESEELRKENELKEAENTELSSKLERVETLNSKLERDTVTMAEALRTSEERYSRLNKQYNYLLDNNSTLVAASARENKALMDQLNDLQQRLQAKEDSLDTERRLLERGQVRVSELERIIRQQDSTLAHVRTTVAKALLGFEGKGLTVEMRNGKVYVSLDNSLLFDPGSWKIAANGKSALENLAAVLAENTDLSILVEGHTDNDPYNGRAQVKDNWDLSVMRATNVVKILVENTGIDPTRVTAAGRGEHMPLVPNTTPENKATNRRTDIILTPNLDELVKMMSPSNQAD